MNGLFWKPISDTEGLQDGKLYLARIKRPNYAIKIVGQEHYYEVARCVFKGFAFKSDYMNTFYDEVEWAEIPE